MSEPADLLITPSGRAVATLAVRSTLQAHESRGAFTRVTLRGYVDTAFLGPARDSFPATVRGRGTVRLRATGSRTAGILAELFAGMGLRTTRRSGGWAQVERSGWVRTSALKVEDSTGAATAGPAQRPPAEPQRSSPSMQASTLATTEATPGGISDTSALLTPVRATEMRSAPNGPAMGSARPGAAVVPLARERGWVRVRVEGWIPERELVPADSIVRGSVSAADLRANPDGYRGRVVHWEVEVLKLQFADPLRPGMAIDEPYLLARGPGGEGAVIYLAVPPSLLSTAASLPPLTRLAVTARVRNGRSEPVGVPILDLLRMVRL